MLIKLLKPLSFIPALVLMFVIFSFSSQDGDTSSNLSYEVSYTIVEAGNVILDADLQPSEISSLATRFNGVVRKLAHMTEYFALAVAVSFPLYVYGLRGLPLMLVAGLFCVAFAASDEFHQSFVDGRGPGVRDVLIDSFGVFWGIVLVRIIGWTGRKTIFRPFSRKKKNKGNGEAAATEDSSYYNTSSVYPPPAQNRPPYQSMARSCQGPASAQNPQMYRSAQSYSGQMPVNGSLQPASSSKMKRHNSAEDLSEDMSLKKIIHDLTDKDKGNE
ncbi:MAG: VanZ family protein [Lachnospiraceae bacterium]|nr:VanZ family protein [Lachnospiraceae bacterium]